VKVKKKQKKEVGQCSFFLLLLQERRYFKEASKFRHRSGLGQTFKDAFVTDVEVADLKNGIQVENLLAFGK
jgi:hypothetical protein